jgi:hypothetical protein
MNLGAWEEYKSNDFFYFEWLMKLSKFYPKKLNISLWGLFYPQVMQTLIMRLVVKLNFKII